MKRKPIKTTKREILAYWETQVEKNRLSIDWSEGLTRCWQCAEKTQRLDRAHIVPHALGGKDAPENLILLCKSCHAEGPNVSDPEIMWDWLQANKASIYGSFWLNEAFSEYKKIYNSSWINDMIRYDLLDITPAEIKKILKKSATIHFGRGRINPVTMAGQLRMVLKEKSETPVINEGRSQNDQFLYASMGISTDNEQLK